MTAHPEEDPRAELRALAAALRAHAQWQAATGATGLPRATAELAGVRAPEAQESARPTPEARAAPPRAETNELERRAETRRGGGAETPPSRRQAAEAPDVTPSSAPSLCPEERAEQLAQLRSEVTACTRCRLHETRTQTVFARGNGSSRLCFVGEGPGADEDAQGIPFVGAAGQLLDRMIAAMGFDRDEVYVCNIVKCRPPGNRKPEPEEMAACRSFLERQLELIEPEVIVALGATAVQGLFGSTEGIKRLRGRWRLYRGEVAVMPTFHPGYLLRDSRAKRQVWEDLQAVLRQMGRPIPTR